MYFRADLCKHVANPQILKQNFGKIVKDFAAVISEKKYSLNFNSDYARLEYLRSQDYKITDYREIEEEWDSTTKFIIELPINRSGTTEDESRAINGLSKRPIITNADKKFFRVLRDDMQ